MPSLVRVYWDACTWISLINREVGRVDCCNEVIRRASNREIEVLTSNISYAEVFKKRCDTIEVGIDEDKDKAFEDLLYRDYILTAQVTVDIGILARDLLRAHDALRKPNDAIHLSTAIYYNCDEFHTFDRKNLIRLNGLIKRSDGKDLPIIEPPPQQQLSFHSAMEQSDA